MVGDTVYTMDSRSLITAFSASNGNRLWRVDLEDDDEDEGYFGGGLTSNDGKLFVSTGFARVFALDAASGEVLWIHKAPSPIRGASCTTVGATT